MVSRTCESLLSVLVPSACRICDSPLLKISRIRVCPACLEQIRPFRGKVGSVCGDRVPSSYAEHDPDGMRRCLIRRRVERRFERTVAYGSYEGGLRELVHLLKYNGVRSDAMQTLEPVLEDAPALSIPVPLFKSRRRRRGFNRAESIAPLPRQKDLGFTVC